MTTGTKRPETSKERAQFTRLTWSETIERADEIYLLESEVAPEVERLVKHKAALLQLAREGLQIQSAATLVMWQKRLEFCIANEPAPPQPTSNDLSYIQEVPNHCDRIIWRGRYYHLENMRPADEIESLRAMIRVKDKDYQALRAAYGSRSDETSDPLRIALQSIYDGIMDRTQDFDMGDIEVITYEALGISFEQWRKDVDASTAKSPSVKAAAPQSATAAGNALVDEIVKCYTEPSESEEV